MNYQEFMNKLTQQLQDMSKDEIITWMKMKAAKIKEGKREDFLQSLYPENTLTTLPNVDWKELNLWCEVIDSGEFYLFKKFNEEYDDWDDDFDDEYEIEDSYEIINKIYDILHKAKQFAYAKDYVHALELYDALFQRTYHVLSECDDFDEMGLLEFLSVDGESTETNSHIFLEYCYLNYVVVRPNSIASIYNIRKQERIRSKLEEAFSTDFGILEHTSSIMHAWIEFLSTKEDADSELLFEALTYNTDTNALIDFCEEHAEVFPTLYHLSANYLFDVAEYEKCEVLCKNGIHLLDQTKRIRSKVMEIGIRASDKLNQKQNEKKFTLEAFRSDSTIEHYLNLMKFDEETLLEEAYQIACTLAVDTSFSIFPSKENAITDITLATIRFLHGDFEELIHELSSNTNALGWSNNSIKFIVSAFLILLAQGQMPYKIKKRLLFYGGINDKDDIAITWFEKQVIMDDRKQEYVNILMEVIDKRTDAILEGMYRKSYYKAALLNIGLQFVFDTLHMNMNAKERCKSRYQRRPAFYQEWEDIIRN